MADSSVLLEVIVEGKNIKLVQRQVEELAGAINQSTKSEEKLSDQQKKTTKSTRDLNNENKNYNKGQKGVAQATANGTKAFSKQRDLIGGGSSGLVGAYATLAANLFAATALFGALQRAAQAETLVEGVRALGAASGKNIPLLAENLKEATNNAISLDQALRTASFATSAGFDSKQIEQLAEVGKKAAIALGRDVGDAVDRLTRGVAKLEPEILDELGIIVRLDDAVASYAAKLGKSTKQLTAFERQQAFANATITQGLSKFGDIDVDPNPYDQLSAALQDLSKTALQLVNTVLGPLVGFFAESKIALGALIAVLTKGIVSQALPVFSQFAQKAKELAAQTRDEITKAAEAQKQAFGSSKTSLSGLAESQGKASKAFKEMFDGAENYDDLIKAEEKLKASIEARTRALKRANRTPESIEKSKEDISELTQLQTKLREELGKKADPGLSVESAQKLSEIADKRAELFESLDQDPSIDNFKKKFGEARKLGGEYAEEMKKAGKFQLSFLNNLPVLGSRLAFVNTLFSSGAVFVSRFGFAAVVALRGITYAIPIIGQAILVITVLIEVIKKAFSVFSDYLPEQSKLSKATEALDANINTLKDSTNSYKTSVIELTKEQENYTAALKDVIDQEQMKKAQEEFSKRSIKNQIILIEGQGTAIQSLVQSYEEYSKELALAQANTGFFGRILRGFSDFADMVAFRTGRGFSKMGKDIKAAYIDSIAAIASFMKEYPSIAKFFGFTQGEIEGALETQKQFNSEQQRTFNDISFLADNVSTKLSRAFLAAFEDSEMGARELTDTILGVGKNIDTKAISTAITSAIENVNAEGLTDELRQLAAAADIDNSGALDVAEAEKFILSLLKEGTKEIVAQAESSKNLSSAITSSSDSLSKFITKLTETSTSVSEVSNNLSIIANELNTSTLSSEILAQKLGELPESVRKLLNFEKLSNEEKVRAVVALSDQLEKIKELEASEKNRLAVIKLQQSLVSGFSKQNEAAAKIQLDLQKDLLTEQSKLVNERLSLAQQVFDSEKRNLDSINETRRKSGQEELETTDSLLASSQNLRALELESLKLASEKRAITGEGLETSLVELEAAKTTIGLREQELKTAQQIANTDIERQKTLLSLQNVISGAGFGLLPEQEFEIKKKQAELAIQIATAEMSIGMERLRLEQKIADIKLQALEAEARSRGDTKLADSIGNLRTDLATSFKEIERATEQSFKAKIDSLNQQLSSIQVGFVFGDISSGGSSSGDVANSALRAVSSVGTAVAMAPNIVPAVEGQIAEAGKSTATARQDLETRGPALQKEIEALEKGTEAYKAKTEELKAVTKAYTDAATTEANLIKDKNILIVQGAIAAVDTAMSSYTDKLKELGSEGALVASIAEGGMQIASSLLTIGSASATAGQKLAAIGGIVSAIGDIYNKASQAKIDAIDKEIEAEKRRDGKSAQSLAKIQALEKKKDAAKKKQFEMNKKIQIAEAIIAGAAGIAQAAPLLANPATFPIGVAVMSMIGALTAAQIAIIAGTSYQGGGSAGSAASQPTAISAGERRNTVDLAKSQSASGELAYMRGEKGTGGPENFTPAFMGAKYRAVGGPTAGYVVGEQGPELFVPSTPGTIVPESKVAPSNPTNVNFTITALDASGVEDILVRQRGNIIGMMREAANSYGQPFMEGVDVASYTQEAGGVTRY